MKKLYQKYLTITELDRKKSFAHWLRAQSLSMIVAIPIAALIIYLVDNDKLSGVEFLGVIVVTTIVHLLSTIWIKTFYKE